MPNDPPPPDDPYRLRALAVALSRAVAEAAAADTEGAAVRGIHLVLGVEDLQDGNGRAEGACLCGSVVGAAGRRIDILEFDADAQLSGRGSASERRAAAAAYAVWARWHKERLGEPGWRRGFAEIVADRDGWCILRDSEDAKTFVGTPQGLPLASMRCGGTGSLGPCRSFDTDGQGGGTHALLARAARLFGPVLAEEVEIRIGRDDLSAHEAVDLLLAAPRALSDLPDGALMLGELVSTLTADLGRAVASGLVLRLRRDGSYAAALSVAGHDGDSGCLAFGIARLADESAPGI